jgi:hypothetical protein
VCFALATAAGASLFVGGRLGVAYALVLAGVSVAMIVLYARLFRAARSGRADDPALLAAADRANHLAGMFFFIVSAATFVDHVTRRLLGH